MNIFSKYAARVIKLIRIPNKMPYKQNAVKMYEM